MKMDYKEDAFQLCLEVEKRCSPEDEEIECNIAIEDCEYITDNDFLYQNPRTPLYLRKLRILDIVDEDLVYYPINFSRFNLEITLGPVVPNRLSPKPRPRGLYAVRFNLEKLKIWVAKELKDEFRKWQEVTVMPKDWGWVDIKRVEYTFGEHGRRLFGGKKRKKVFQEFMNLFEKTPPRVIINDLFPICGLKDRNRLRIELNAISSRLKKIGIKLVGTGNGYYIVQKKNPAF